MYHTFLLTCEFLVILFVAEASVRPQAIVFPVPLDLPNRNDRSEQCWLRIEDTEITETLTVYCTIAQAFLSYYIHDYNDRMIKKDNIDVSLWVEKPRGNDPAYGPPEKSGIVDWRVNTVMDPTTRRRIYVSQQATCRLIMYTREGMTNYIIDCDTILYFVNEHSSGVAISSARTILLFGLFLIYFNH